MKFFYNMNVINNIIDTNISDELMQIVDVDAGKCDKAFAYVPDLGGYGIVVYSWADNDSWRIKHNFFHFDPLKGDFNVGGVNFQWTDGVFGLALGPVEKSG